MLYIQCKDVQPALNFKPECKAHINKRVKSSKKNTRSSTHDKLKAKISRKSSNERKNTRYHDDITEKLAVILKLRKQVKVNLIV
jgi:hypothetical protein